MKILVKILEVLYKHLVYCTKLNTRLKQKIPFFKKIWRIKSYAIRKIKDTCLKRYGFKHPMQSEEVKEKN